MRAYLLMMLISAVVTFIGTFATLKISHRYKLYPQIRARDVHTKPTPRLGGVAMFLGFLVTMPIAGSLGWFESVFAEPIHVFALIAAAFLITLIGFLDDLYDLDWSLKLAGQFVVAGLLAWQGVQIVSLPIGGLTIGSFGISRDITDRKRSEERIAEQAALIEGGWLDAEGWHFRPRRAPGAAPHGAAPWLH